MIFKALHCKKAKINLKKFQKYVDKIFCLIYNVRVGPMVKRLRHHPFTVVSGVRFPLGVPPYHLFGDFFIPPKVNRTYGFDSCRSLTATSCSRSLAKNLPPATFLYALAPWDYQKARHTNLKMLFIIKVCLAF